MADPASSLLRLWEIVNPSDPYTFRAADFLTAVAVVTLLGQGKYGLKCCDGTEPRQLPFLMFGGGEEWLKENYGDFGEWMKAHADELAAALDSVMSFRVSERRAFDAAMQRLPESERDAYRDEVHDRNRTSLNDIGARAWDLAKWLRERKAANA